MRVHRLHHCESIHGGHCGWTEIQDDGANLTIVAQATTFSELIDQLKDSLRFRRIWIKGFEIVDWKARPLVLLEQDRTLEILKYFSGYPGSTAEPIFGPDKSFIWTQPDWSANGLILPAGDLLPECAWIALEAFERWGKEMHQAGKAKMPFDSVLGEFVGIPLPQRE